MKQKTIFTFVILLIFAFTSQAAETTEALQSASSEVIFLTSDQMYNLLVYAIIGSLGVLGLLLGLDKVIIILLDRDSGKAQKYSSESVARILPIVIEGITVILVILTVIILGVSKIISAEGTLGILGSIVGYVLGKSSRKNSTPNNKPTA